MDKLPDDDYKCCVCYEVKKFTHDGRTILNGLACGGDGNHRVCCKCIKKLLRDCGGNCEDCRCLGYSWKCPLCRRIAGLCTPSQLVAVMSESWKTVVTIEERGGH